LFDQRTIEGVKRTVTSGLVLGFSVLALLFALTPLFGLSAVALPFGMYDDVKFGTSVSTEVKQPLFGNQPNIGHAGLFSSLP
jgi:hypothetical protein